MMPYRSPRVSPAHFVWALMAAGEAFYGIAGGCRAASPLPTLRECTMPGAHVHTPRSPHVSHAVAAALCISYCSCVASRMRLCSTREWLRRASGLKAATRRLSCTTRSSSRLHRAATSGAWRMASMC